MNKTVLILWTSLALTSLGALFYYANLPGPAGHVQSQWPTLSKLVPPQDRPVFLVFLHPQCACSAATVSELENLLPQFKDKVEVRVVFMKYSSKRAPASVGKLLDQVKALPGITIHSDEAGVETKQFGALTSGHSYLYDHQGQLVFSGGITPARGHMGESSGKSFIQNWLKDRQAANSFLSDIFGCKLFGES